MTRAKYAAYYPLVEQNRRYLEYLLAQITAQKDPRSRLLLARIAAYFATYHHTGYFTSSVLENVFAQHARTLKIPLAGISCRPNSFLHVLTEGYETGGHTRVVERWIEFAPPHQTHSAVILCPTGAALKTLQAQIAAKHGQYICFDNNLTLEQKALELRKLAAGYEFIVLHTHMEDPTAVLAFATPDFTRPVFLYNHASHLFWVGKSAADVVLDIQQRDGVTREKRGIENPFFVGIPSAQITFADPDKQALRRRLNLPADKKIIISSGSEFKYMAIGGDDFLDVVRPLMDDNTYLYFIGVPNTGRWKAAFESSKGHIVPMGYIPFNQGFTDYIAAADLYLDSYPLCGGTACMDAVAAGTPVLSLQSVYPQFDYLIHTPAYCTQTNDFLEKARKVLNEPAYARELLTALRTSLAQNQSPAAWNARLEKLLQAAPRTHRVLNPTAEADEHAPCDLAVLDNIMLDPNFLTRPFDAQKAPQAAELLKNGFPVKKSGVHPLFEKQKCFKGDTVVKRITCCGLTLYRREKAR